jgi:hypothetical protein
VSRGVKILIWMLLERETVVELPWLRTVARGLWQPLRRAYGLTRSGRFVAWVVHSR